MGGEIPRRAISKERRRVPCMLRRGCGTKSSSLENTGGWQGNRAEWRGLLQTQIAMEEVHDTLVCSITVATLLDHNRRQVEISQPSPNHTGLRRFPSVDRARRKKSGTPHPRKEKQKPKQKRKAPTWPCYTRGSTWHSAHNLFSHSSVCCCHIDATGEKGHSPSRAHGVI